MNMASKCDKVEIENLLNETDFDRTVAPKTNISDLMVSLLKKGAYDEKSAILLSNYPVNPANLDNLIKTGRVKIFSNSPTKIYLTDMGQIIAAGELSLRNHEKKRK